MPDIARLPLDSEQDRVAARRLARTVAAALGLPALDQARVTQAVTGVGEAGAELDISLSVGAEPALVIAVHRPDATPARTQRFPLPDGRPESADLAGLRAQLTMAGPASAVQELQAQDDLVVDTLEQLAARQDDLAHLSGELEMTNRGVVALYAELDERGVRLRDANNAKSRFLASVSHELRSPLNSVVALAQLLSEPDSDPLTAAQANQIRLIAKSAGQLLAMVNGLLDLARAESGGLQPSVDTVDLHALFAELRSTLRPITPDVVELVFEAPERALVSSDPVLLAQVLRNLVGNALKFTADGRVSVTAAPDRPGLLRIAVTDTGIGIAPEHRALVFEEFFQVPGPRQVAQRGTGLGLPYSRRVLEALGSTLTVSSRLGVGSTFTFFLPLAGAEVPDRPAGILHSVLIADDEDQFRTVLREALDGMCETVLEADDGESAMRVIRESSPDLVLLDLRMPGGGGEGVLEWLARHPTLHALPVVVVTSMSPAEVAELPLAGTRPLLDKSDLSPGAVRAALDLALREGTS